MGIKETLHEATKDIDELIESLMGPIKQEMAIGVENIDTNEFGSVADILKDFAEAKHYMVKSCYYQYVLESMEEGAEDKKSYAKWIMDRPTEGDWSESQDDMMDRNIHNDRVMR